MRLLAFFCCTGLALAQSQPEEERPEPAAVVELGAAPGRSLSDHTWNFGPTIAVEVTPVEKWLELELGVTASRSAHATEWTTDLLFKKPWTLSKKVEFMAGIGPEWIHSRGSNALGLGVVLDFMFWPSPKSRLGWYVEPGYDYRFGHAHDRSIGITFGMLLAIPRKSTRV